MEFVALCRLYRASASAILRPSSVQLDISVKFRRDQKTGTLSKGAEEAVNLLVHLSTASVEIERLLGKERSVAYPPETPIQPGDVDLQAEDAAISLRHYLGLGNAPVRDIVSILELDLGFRVFIRPLASNISGVFAFGPETGPCVLLNSQHPQTRRAYSGAHELGHFMSTRTHSDVFDERQKDGSREERFANSFAGAFLMPGPAIRRRYEEFTSSQGKFSPRHLILMAHAHHVSPEAMCRRLEKMKLLKQGTFDSLRERGFDRDAVVQVIGDEAPAKPLAVPPRMAILAAEAYYDGRLSEGQLAEMFRLDRTEIRLLLEALEAGDFGDATLLEP